MLSRIISNALIGVIVLTTIVYAQALPSPSGFFNDYTGTLSTETVSELESTLRDYEQQTGREIAVAIIERLSDTTIDDYAVRLFEQWGIGKKGKDNGVLFLIALQDRKMRIEVGYGLEPVLTDVQAKQILDDIVRPAFRAGDYDGGVKAGVDAIIKTLNNEPIEDNLITKTRRTIWDTGWSSLLLYIALFGSIYFFSVAARSKNWYAGGIWGLSIGSIIGILAASVLIWLVLAGILGVFGLVFDYIVSAAYREAKLRHRSPPWWAGGRSHFWSGFDSRSSGGFGGGFSGGGGASGGW